MAEEIRSIKVRIEVDTNKRTWIYEDGNAELATLEREINDWIAAHVVGRAT